jgi:periplasmic mercuric ion binding protein
MQKILTAAFAALALGAASVAAHAQAVAQAQAQAPAAAAADAGTVKFSVNGMVCAFCAQGIEKRLTKMSETGPLYINLAQKVVAVQPKPGMRIDVDRVKAEIVEAGYEVTATQPVPLTVAAIRAEMKAK